MKEAKNILACEKCKSVCQFAKSNKLVGTGPLNPEIMFLMDAPDEVEDSSGSSFSGRGMGWFRKNIMKPLNMAGSDYYYNYSVKCRPTKKGKGGFRLNAVPDRRTIVNCREHVIGDIAIVKPKVIVLMGNAALCSALYLDKVSGVTRWRGKPMWSREFNCWLIATHNPISVMMDFNIGRHSKYNQMIEDMKSAMTLVYRDAPKTRHPQYQLLDDETEVIKYLNAFHASDHSDTIAVDSETDGFDPRNEILGMSLCYRNGRKYFPVYIPWDVIDGSQKVSEMIDDVFVSKKIAKILHNIDFDRKFFFQHGFRMDGPLYDTMTMAQLLDENFSIGLKERTWIDLDFGGYEIPLEQYKYEHKFTKSSSYKDIPVDVMAPYAAYDTYATLRLYEEYRPRLSEEKLIALYDKISSPVRTVMTDASINGIYVDMDQVGELDKRMTKAKHKLEQSIYSTVGFEFNFNSTTQLGKLLFEEMRAPNMGKTKADNWKCDKAVLAALAKKTVKRKYVKLAQDILKYKYIDKLQGTYIGQAKTFIWKDGRVHSSYNLCGTVTGRASNSKPCTHNIPQDRLIRSLYRCSPGNFLIEADIKSAEMRAIAACSNDKILMKIFEMGVDIHEQTYREMFQKSDDYKPTQDERRIAKSINFGLIYGITAVGLARRLGIDPDVAQKYINLYFERFSGVARWLDETVKFAKKHGYVVSLFGRRRRLPEVKSDDKFEVYRAVRQAMNSPIQGLASDYCYISLIRVAKELKKRQLKSKIIHTVHDCILVDAVPSEVALIKKIINWAFKSGVKALPITMEVDIEVGERWGEHKESKLDEMLKELAA